MMNLKNTDFPGFKILSFSKISDMLIQAIMPTELVQALRHIFSPQSYMVALPVGTLSGRGIHQQGFMPLVVQYSYTSQPADENEQINPLAIKTLMAIKQNSDPVRQLPCLSVYSNRKIVLFAGNGKTEEEARFLADYWYQTWRKDHRQAGEVFKVIEKSYTLNKNEQANFYCELKIKYAYKQKGNA